MKTNILKRIFVFIPIIFVALERNVNLYLIKKGCTLIRIQPFILIGLFLIIYRHG